MADTTEFAIHSGSSWLTQATGETARFGGSGGPLTNLSLNTFNRYFGFLDSGGTTIRQGEAVTYDTPTKVKLNGATAVDLTPANVGVDNTCLRFHFKQDGGASVEIENVKFFAYSGATTTAPPGATITAFAVEGSAIEKDTDVVANGKAWNESYGIGGSANALTIPDRGVSAVDHYFYFGVSAKGSSSGTNSFTLAIEYDVV